MESYEEQDMSESPSVRRQGRKPRSTIAHAVDERLETERGFDERDVQEREITEDDRLEMFRDSLQQSVLPDLPPMPGFHVCWLSTSNPRDSIQWRIRIGYELIRTDDLPGWDGVSLKTGDYAGVIGVNEMVAAKIPLGLYNKYMREVHHNMPLHEEEKLRTRTELLKDQAKAMGSIIEEGDGMAEIVQRARPMAEFDA